MGKPKIIVEGIFKTVTPLCTISTIKEGYSGFILDSSFVIYTKKGTDNQYLRIRKDAKVFEEELESNMLGIDKKEGIISIRPTPGAYFYVNDTFDDDITLYIDEIEIQYEEVCFFGDFEVEEEQNEIDMILARCKTLQEKHQDFIDYCYKIEAEEKGMLKFAEKVEIEMAKALPNMQLSVLRMFEDEVKTQDEILKEKVSILKNKDGYTEEDEIPNFRILGDYLNKVIDLIDDFITKKENIIPERRLSKLDINELVELLNKTKDEQEKELIKREIDKKVKETRQ